MVKLNDILEQSWAWSGGVFEKNFRVSLSGQTRSVWDGVPLVCFFSSDLLTAGKEG